MKYYIAIPTYNGGDTWYKVALNIQACASKDLLVHVIDSGSNDNTISIAKNANFDIVGISSSEFNHGGTRNLAVYKYIEYYDIVILLTQDAIPQDNFIKEIIAVFDDKSIACAYGRQLPHDNANPLAQHARKFNYSDKSYICGKEDISKMGLKTVFMSNSFSAYRLSTFKELGGFPSDTILCEDMYYTAKAVLAGYRVAYVAEATVKHSHNYSPIEEFKRYFDIGVFHADESWIRQNFSGATKEGQKFIVSELKYLLKKAPLWIPYACINNVMKFLGYKMGQNYSKLPRKLIKKLSMHKKYWIK
ncbi:TPA: glycosyltransferase family 2 protein [Klebsiella pneumoniae]|nr:glycosyltransferase family 2 protein [Klebsiella pneumoniae]